MLTVVAFSAATANPHGDPSQYTYTHSVSLDPDEPPPPPPQEDPVVCSSSLMYGEGFLISSQAMMVSGGDLFGQIDYSDDFDDSEDENDDDDDDDDGHSSMLSTASLRRATANGTPWKSRSENKPSSDKDIPSSRRASSATVLRRRLAFLRL